MSNASRDIFIDYVKKSTDHGISAATTYYLGLFDTYSQDAKTPPWFANSNWAALFLGPIWLAYRGMFWAALIFLLLYQGIGLFSAPTQMIGTTLLWLVFGFYANALYLKHINYWIENDNIAKKGVDITMALLMAIVFTLQVINHLA